MALRPGECTDYSPGDRGNRNFQCGPKRTGKSDVKRRQPTFILSNRVSHRSFSRPLYYLSAGAEGPPGRGATVRRSTTSSLLQGEDAMLNKVLIVAGATALLAGAAAA